MPGAATDTFVNAGKNQPVCAWNAYCVDGVCKDKDSNIPTVKHEALNAQGCTSDTDLDKCLVNADEDVFGASFPTGSSYRPSDARPCSEIDATNRLTGMFKRNMDKYPQTISNFLGMQETGIYRTWPTLYQCRTEEICSGCSDPRYRGWYASAASGKKAVVIVLDTSGSMASTGTNRDDSARVAAGWVINTLSGADKATLVTFNSGATTVPTQYLGKDNAMMPMTAANKKDLKDYINSPTQLGFSGGTNFVAAFQNAFDALEETSAADCEKVILFMTDGGIDSRGFVGGDPLELIRDRNGGIHNEADPGLADGEYTRIFTYTFGSGDKNLMQVRSIAIEAGRLASLTTTKPFAIGQAVYYGQATSATNRPSKNLP